MGSVPSGHDLTITAVLRPTHTGELSALLRDLYDPSSPRYEQWLTPAEFIHDFGPSPAQIDTVTSWLRAQGLTTRGARDGGDRDRGRPTPWRARSSVSFSSYRLAGGATGYVASNAPLVSARGRREHLDDHRPLRHDPLRQPPRSHAARAAPFVIERAARGGFGKRGRARRTNCVRRRPATSRPAATGPRIKSGAATTSTTCSPRASPARARRSRCSSWARAGPPTRTTTSPASACTTR